MARSHSKPVVANTGKGLNFWTISGNPRQFKQDNIPVTYMQMGIWHEKGSDQLRLSLPKDLKSYMEENYGIHEKFLYLENKIFRSMDHIKQLWKDIFIKRLPECSLYGVPSSQKEE